MASSSWTNVEILAATETTAPPVQQQTDTEWPRMTYIQRLLWWVRARVRRLFTKEPHVVEEKQPEFGSVAREYLYDIHDVDLQAAPHI